MIKTDNVDQLLDDPRVPQPDDIQRKAEKILKDIKRRTAFFGELIPIDLEHEHSAFFAKNRQEFQSLLTMLLEQHLLSKDSSIDAYRVIAPSADSNQVWLLSLTGKAFERFSLGVFGSKVFIACRFTPDHQACIDAMCTGVRGAHFEPMCLINEVFSERIMDKALAEIAESRYVVVDLTGGRLSVALETGYALALEKEIIFVAHESERENREFYSGHYRISYYRDERQLAEIVMNAILIRSKLKDRLA